MKTSHKKRVEPPVRLPHGPMDFVPVNEMGVVFLFSYLAKKTFGAHVLKIRSGFPDCEVRVGNETKRVEFEYRSSSFKSHRHKSSNCDWLVCWEHNWPAAPAKLRIIELRREFGLGFNVWLVALKKEYAQKISGAKSWRSWSVPASAGIGDLLLIYRSKPDHMIDQIFKVTSRVKKVKKAKWKGGGSDYMAAIRWVAKLRTPLHLQEMKRDPVLRGTGFVRNLQGRKRVTVHWPTLFARIVERNPSVRNVLKNDGPSRLN